MARGRKSTVVHIPTAHSGQADIHSRMSFGPSRISIMIKRTIHDGDMLRNLHTLLGLSRPKGRSMEGVKGEACTTTDYVSDGTTTSSTTLRETITGCSISVSDSTTEVIDTQIPAPVGTFGDERWATMTMGVAFTRSLFSAIEARRKASFQNTLPGFMSVSLRSAVGMIVKAECVLHKG